MFAIDYFLSRVFLIFDMFHFRNWLQIQVNLEETRKTQEDESYPEKEVQSNTGVTASYSGDQKLGQYLLHKCCSPMSPSNTRPKRKDSEYPAAIFTQFQS